MNCILYKYSLMELLLCTGEEGGVRLSDHVEASGNTRGETSWCSAGSPSPVKVCDADRSVNISDPHEGGGAHPDLVGQTGVCRVSNSRTAPSHWCTPPMTFRVPDMMKVNLWIVVFVLKHPDELVRHINTLDCTQCSL